MGSCESELVAAFLCLDGGCLSRHPFVDTAVPSPAAPALAGHRVGSTTLSRTAGRSHQVDVL